MNNGKKKSKTSRKPHDAPSAPLAPLPLSTVLRAIAREQSRALIHEFLAEQVMSLFAGTESADPKKLLAMPDGSRRPADLVDVVEIVAELQRVAHEARRRMRRLREAGVLVDSDALARDEASHSRQAPPPPGEGIVDVGGGLPGDTPARRRERQSEGLRRDP